MRTVRGWIIPPLFTECRMNGHSSEVFEELAAADRSAICRIRHEIDVRPNTRPSKLVRTTSALCETLTIGRELLEANGRTDVTLVVEVEWWIAHRAQRVAHQAVDALPFGSAWYGERVVIYPEHPITRASRVHSSSGRSAADRSNDIRPAHGPDSDGCG